jgi:hypothetical protein
MNVNQGVMKMDNETIDLAARLGEEGVAELRSLHDKAGRLALMIHDKFMMPGVGYVGVTDGVGIWVLEEDLSVVVFPPRVIEVFHGVEVEISAPYIDTSKLAVWSEHFERGLAPVDRISPVAFTMVFEGETFVIEVWPNGDDTEIIPDLYEDYGVKRACFCNLVDRRPAVSTTQGGV